MHGILETVPRQTPLNPPCLQLCLLPLFGSMAGVLSYR